ncbi:MAG: T9SS C-terminal target domain-containing protein [Flavobacteriales bacterium]|nr:T9SS C-terminal target domain-containing protein [Flavobacteriales bacterium]
MRKLITLLLGLFVALASGAQTKDEYVAQQRAQENSEGTRAVGCAPATALRDLEWNNVRALISTNGALWHNRSSSQGAYDVPKSEGVGVIYGGALWMGGLSPDLQLKMAAMRYGNGNDFWPGPLSNDGAAETDESICDEYDRFTTTYRLDAIRHRQYFECLADPDCDLVGDGLAGYTIPSYFYDYPAHGNTALNQDYYLAPFYDYDDDGNYDPAAGDYPWYDFIQEINCAERRREDRVPLFGDFNLFWIFNDKGNIHSETQGEPIGMEIRAQAFAFSTNDEINNMTFYNYVLINQGTQTLTETYFGAWVDCDIGGFPDDYVGCDVQRGLGYAYNADAFDDPSAISLGYGANPPAMGVDFFEGPYQDADGFDNPLTSVFTDAIDSLGIPYGGIGIGYGDDVIDNERFGMRKFLYYNFSGAANGPPTTAAQYYQYMRGFWRNGQRMVYYGDGLTPGSGADLNIPADYMFPGDTDPFSWGTGGVQVEPWTEQTAGNPGGDRLFLQSAGPFTLAPGDYNNITVGVLWTRANGGNPFESVELLRIADDKAQALFDNCFEIVAGPDAPDVTVQELENEVILYLTNDNSLSNNFNETYEALDPAIPTSTTSGENISDDQRKYKFQGYQIYQLKDASVSVSELDDIDKARLLFTTDVRDEIDAVINYDRDPTIDLPVPTIKANGPNEGIRHSFQIKQDAFATGDNALINHKTYYYLVLAYGYNNYETYNPVNNTGQDEQYKASRAAAGGTAIRVYTAIPHKPSPEAGGTIALAQYGDGVELTRWEGKGNGLLDLAITKASEDAILANTFSESLTYQAGRGPVEVKVVDPLRVPAADFELRLAPDDADLDSESAFWVLTNLSMLADSDPSNDEKAVYNSKTAISVLNEEVLLDWGISVTWNQYEYGFDNSNNLFTEPISGSITFANSDRPWLGGIADEEGFSELNWIRAGTQDGDDAVPEEVVFDDLKPGDPLDENEAFEGVVGGTWAPYCLVSYTDAYTPTGGTQEIVFPNVAPTINTLRGDLSPFSNLNGLNNVDVVLTSDKSKWTRCAVLEMQANPDLAEMAVSSSLYDDPEKMRLRRHESVDKNGRTVSEGASPAEATLNGSQPIGMGWFPGYAIDLGTGERLNMAFGEDSWFAADNGKDMIWNPSGRLASNLGNTIYAGGQHWIYIFKNGQYEEATANRMPAYDQGQYLYTNLEAEFTSTLQRRVFRACTWVGSAILNEGYEMLPISQGLIPNETRISLRVAKAYEKYSPSQLDPEEYTNAENFWNPYYTFSTRGMSTTTNSTATLEEALKYINVVPNPYYAYSEYETSKLDNRVKVTNLPEECTVTIYNLQGTLIRQYVKADPLTSLDWDLKNFQNVPIAGGVYLIHIDVPGVGEKILKWFGVMRPTDLDRF